MEPGAFEQPIQESLLKPVLHAYGLVIRTAAPEAVGYERRLAQLRAFTQPVVSSAKGDKIDPVSAQMASYLACSRSSARLALVRMPSQGSPILPRTLRGASTSTSTCSVLLLEQDMVALVAPFGLRTGFL
jgi:hypothetical protein